MLKTRIDVEDMIYSSFLRAKEHLTEVKDEMVRQPKLTKELFTRLNSPDRGQRVVLVTGSKGKGSTARFLSSLLSYNGLKVGLFTSPHLVDFNERIRIDGKTISDEAFIRIGNKIEQHVNDIEATLAPQEYQGPIGIILAIAMIHFSEQQTDINVIECGRGGLYDDANILQNELAVITPIMEEHKNELGPRIEDIIHHKLGIVKEKTKVVVIGPQASNQTYIKGCIAANVEKRIFGEDFSVVNERIDKTGTSFDVAIGGRVYQNLRIPLLGTFQAENVATALSACEAIIGHKKLNEYDWKHSLSTIRWPGRCEIIETSPTVIVDGAINKESALKTKGVIERLHAKNIISIVGVPKDKDYVGVLQVVSSFSKQIILTKPDRTHLAFPDDAKAKAATFHANVLEAKHLDEALKRAKADQSVDVILIVGTQTLIANALRLRNNSLMDIGK